MSEHREGWSAPKPEHIPRPTAWPAGLALGITFFAWGLITSPIVLGVGLALFRRVARGLDRRDPS